MGIRYLNKYLIDKCSKESITQIHLSQLESKTIVIDTSIYLYKFIGEGMLAENLYILLTLFKKYKINALFVFEGTPPPEKWDTIEIRNKEKDKAEVMYENLTRELEKSDYTVVERDKIMLQLQSVKKQCIRIKKHHIMFAKNMMDCFGIKYIDAYGESDEICAKLCKSQIAFGCLSDDMDMFTYGCSNILRNLNLINEEVTLYNYDKIIFDLNLKPQIFTQLLILSSNDYYKDNTNDFNKVMEWYYAYKKMEVVMPFKNWLIENNYIQHIEDINNVEKIYTIDNNIEINVHNLNETIISQNDMKYTKLKELLRPHGFIFLNE